MKEVIRNYTRKVPRGEAKEFDDEAHNGIATAGDNSVLQVIVRTRSNALVGAHVITRTWQSVLPSADGDPAPLTIAQPLHAFYDDPPQQAELTESALELDQTTSDGRSRLQ